MKNLLIVLGLIATVSSASANNLAEKSNNNATVFTTAHSPNAIEIGGDDKDKERPKP